MVDDAARLAEINRRCPHPGQPANFHCAQCAAQIMDIARRALERAEKAEADLARLREAVAEHHALDGVDDPEADEIDQCLLPTCKAMRAALAGADGAGQAVRPTGEGSSQMAEPQSTAPAKPREDGPKTHDLKTWPQFYRAVIDGRKTFEVRKNDRGFAEGDTLVLREWKPDTKNYTGLGVCVRVNYLVELPCMPGFVGMSIEKPPAPEPPKAEPCPYVHLPRTCPIREWHTERNACVSCGWVGVASEYHPGHYPSCPSRGA